MSSMSAALMIPGPLRSAVRWPVVVCTLLVALCMAGCSSLQLVASYDEKTFEETIRIGREVDLFYAKLVDVPKTERQYAPYSDRYAEIEADIRSLVRRNAARPLNGESQEISNRILKFWTEYRDKHRTENAYDDAFLDRKRFDRLFNAAVAAEEVKRLQDDDRN